MNEVMLNKFCLLKKKEFVERLEEIDINFEKVLNQQTFYDSETNSQNCFDWLSWCKLQSGRIKVIDYEIPSQILPTGYKGFVYDIKVQGKKWAPDDQLYNDHDDLRARVARGNTVLLLENDTSNHKKVYDRVIFALKKFTGGMGDEDDSQPENDRSWMKFFLKPQDEAKTVICTRKANGEAAHLSVRFIEQQCFLVVGSKNVHILISTYSDIEKYLDSRFQYAKVIARAVLDTLSTFNDDSLLLLLNFLHYTKLTAVFELLQPMYQHIENLSTLKSNTLQFIAWTLAYDENDRNSKSYCAISPDKGIQFAQKLGFQTVIYDSIDPRDVPSRMDSIRLSHGFEGEVMYFMDECENVIGLMKKKTAWYIVLRAIREKAVAAFAEWKKLSNFNQASWSRKVKSRLKDIQGWVCFSDKFCDSWAKLGFTFIVWVIHLCQGKLEKNIENNKLKRIINDVGIRPQFPTIWKQFLNVHNLSDSIAW